MVQAMRQQQRQLENLHRKTQGGSQTTGASPQDAEDADDGLEREEGKEEEYDYFYDHIQEEN